MKLFLLMLGVLLIAAPAHAITFNDGGTHIIDADNSYPLEGVVVEDSPTGQPTTLIINEGGDIGSISGDGLTGNGASVITLNGGTVQGDLIANETTDLTIASGSVNGTVRGADSSSILIVGGTNLRVVTSGDNAALRIEGGVFRGCYPSGALGTCWGNRNGGDFSGQRGPPSIQVDSGPFLMTGVFDIEDVRTPVIRIYGDAVSPAIYDGPANPAASIQLYSGSLELLAGSIGHIELHGSGQVVLSQGMSVGSISGQGYFSHFPSLYPGSAAAFDGTLLVDGATIGGGLNLPGSSTLSMTGGSVSGEVTVTCPNSGCNNHISGGEILGSFNASGGAEVTLSGGEFLGALNVSGGAAVIFTGGSMVASSHSLQGEDSAIVISGGIVSPGTFVLSETSRLELIGFDFSHPYGPVSGSTGTITGTLSDGSFISIDFQRASTASILLRAPATPTNSDLAVSLVSPPTTVDTYGTVNLSFSVTNNGPDPADNVEVTFEAPATAINPTITTGTWSQSGSTFTSDLGTLASGASSTFEMTYSVGGDAGTLDHQVSVLSNMYDPISIDADETNNTETAAITVQCGTTTVFAQNPTTGTWVAFPSSCDVPPGWTVSQTIPDGFEPIGADSDDDGVVDENDNCPAVANPDQANSDGDSQGDACDLDNDNDGVPDENDNCPAIANPEQDNNDSDLNGDVCDLDNDNDGIADVATTVNTVSRTSRTAGHTNLYVPDGIGPTFVIGQIIAIALDDGSTFSPIITSYDEADTEIDRIWFDRPFPSPMSAGNAVTQTIADLDPMDPAICIDADVDTCDDCSVGVDGFGALADNDPANDGTDTDSDGACDAGDNDDDNDGVPDEADAFSLDATENADTDSDGVGNNADTDDDGDGYSDAEEVAAGSDPLDPNSIPAEVAVPSLSPMPLTTLAALLLTLGLTALGIRRRHR